MTRRPTLMLTGATGFLGSHLLAGLLTATGYRVVVLKRSTSRLDRIASLAAQHGDRLAFYDVDTESLEGVFQQEAPIELIVHTATEYGRSGHNTSSVLETNLMFPIRLIEAAMQHGVSCFINTDSYFNKPNRTYLNLMNYSLSKKSLLLWLHYFSEQIKVINIVLEHIYGEWDSPEKFTEQVIRRVALEKATSMALSPGDQIRDFIYVQDVVSAYLHIIQHCVDRPFRLKTLNIGSGVPTSIKQFAETVKALSASPTMLDFRALPFRKDEIMYSCADLVDAESIGWQPATTLEAGLSRIITQYQRTTPNREAPCHA